MVCIGTTMRVFCKKIHNLIFVSYFLQSSISKLMFCNVYSLTLNLYFQGQIGVDVYCFASQMKSKFDHSFYNLGYRLRGVKYLPSLRSQIKSISLYNICLLHLLVSHY